MNYYRIQYQGESFETDISCNSGSYGGTIIVLVSDHTSIGNSTYSAVFMLRLGYNGNYVTTTKIAEDGTGKIEDKTFSCSSNGNLVLNGRGKYLVLKNG